MELSVNELLQAVIAALTASAATWVSLRRKLSQDTKSIESDKQEIALMATMRAERDYAVAMAREASELRLADRETIAKQSGQIEMQERELFRLREELLMFRLQLRKVTTMLVKIDPAAAALLDLGSGTDGLEQPKERAMTGGLLK